MGFASSWLDKRALFPEFIKEKPAAGTAIIVVVPAFNEPSLSSLFDSLLNCHSPHCSSEVIVVVNAPPDASSDYNAVNQACMADISVWKDRNRNSFFSIHTISPDTSSFSEWGVGLARKTGMDEAIRRFDAIDEREGVIACLDADCRVREDYFLSLYEDFYRRKERKACSVYFEHPLSGSEFAEEVYRYIASYELHLRYFVRALAFAGYPFAFHTVGSSMGVKALQYIRAGGMNRRQAGEDFYFIQKLIPAGGFFKLCSTTVFPSPRTSDRVPFGTGAAMSAISETGKDTFLSYDLSAFLDLKILFTMTEQLRSVGEKETEMLFGNLPVSLRTFIGKEEFMIRTAEIRSNTATQESFVKRFFVWFNMFRIIKYLNRMHEDILERRPVGELAARLLIDSGIDEHLKSTRELLEIYRRLDREC